MALNISDGLAADALYRDLHPVYMANRLKCPEIAARFGALWQGGAGMTAGEAMKLALLECGIPLPKNTMEQAAEEYDEIMKIQELAEGL